MKSLPHLKGSRWKFDPGSTRASSSILSGQTEWNRQGLQNYFYTFAQTSFCPVYAGWVFVVSSHNKEAWYIEKTLKKSDHVKPELAVQLTVLELRRKFPDMSPKAANLIWNENDQDISYHNFFPKAVLERVKGSWGQNFSFFVRRSELTVLIPKKWKIWGAM